MERIKTKTELLIEDFKQHFKSCDIKRNRIIVSDGVNKQEFILETRLITDIEYYYTPEAGKELADLIWMNFKHIYDDES